MDVVHIENFGDFNSTTVYTVANVHVNDKKIKQYVKKKKNQFRK